MFRGKSRRNTLLGNAVTWVSRTDDSKSLSTRTRKEFQAKLTVEAPCQPQTTTNHLPTLPTSPLLKYFMIDGANGFATVITRLCSRFAPLGPLTTVYIFATLHHHCVR